MIQLVTLFFYSKCDCLTDGCCCLSLSLYPYIYIIVTENGLITISDHNIVLEKKLNQTIYRDI